MRGQTPLVLVVPLMLPRPTHHAFPCSCGGFGHMARDCPSGGGGYAYGGGGGGGYGGAWGGRGGYGGGGAGGGGGGNCYRVRRPGPRAS
jgi:hypothetical protein